MPRCAVIFARDMSQCGNFRANRKWLISQVPLGNAHITLHSHNFHQVGTSTHVNWRLGFHSNR